MQCQYTYYSIIDNRVSKTQIMKFDREKKMQFIILLSDKTIKNKHSNTIKIDKHDAKNKCTKRVRSKNSKLSKDCDSNFVKQFDYQSSNDFEKNQFQLFYNSINDTFNRLKFSVEVYRIRTIE